MPRTQMSHRALQVAGGGLLIAALTFVVSRKLGLTVLFLPLFFAWGSGKGRL
jgi:hypothetical protein